MNIYIYDVIGCEDSHYVAAVNLYEAEELIFKEHGMKSLNIKKLNEKEILYTRAMCAVA